MKSFSIVECFEFIKVANNQYEKLTFTFEIPTSSATKLMTLHRGKPVPIDFLTFDEKTGMPILVIDGKKYKAK